jgi:hypothetical protein
MQVSALEQLMENSCEMPPPMPGSLHVAPPSWLTMTLEPTPMHVVVVGQATAAIPATLLGSVAWFQVVPPSLEVNRTPRLPAPVWFVMPPATHSLGL